MRRVLDIYSICQLLGCSQGPSVPHWHMLQMSCAREWKHRCSYKSKVQMTSRWGLWNYGFAMLNSFFKKIIFNGTQETAVCKAIPYAKAWVRFNSERCSPWIFGCDARETQSSIIQRLQQATQGRQGGLQWGSHALMLSIPFPTF